MALTNTFLLVDHTRFPLPYPNHSICLNKFWPTVLKQWLSTSTKIFLSVTVLIVSINFIFNSNCCLLFSSNLSKLSITSLINAWIDDFNWPCFFDKIVIKSFKYSQSLLSTNVVTILLRTLLMKPNRKTDEFVSPRQDTYLMLACSQRSFQSMGIVHLK